MPPASPPTANQSAGATTPSENSRPGSRSRRGTHRPGRAAPVPPDDLDTACRPAASPPVQGIGDRLDVIGKAQLRQTGRRRPRQAAKKPSGCRSSSFPARKAMPPGRRDREERRDAVRRRLRSLAVARLSARSRQAISGDPGDRVTEAAEDAIRIADPRLEASDRKAMQLPT